MSKSKRAKKKPVKRSSVRPASKPKKTKKPPMYDLLIIGAGPAGLSAAIYAARQKMNFAIISKNIGGQTLWSSDVENYLGFHLVSGAQLVQKFQEHIKDYNIELKHETVKRMGYLKRGFHVQTDKQKYYANTVIIASGKKPKKLKIPGEQEFWGKGVAYCAVCDAPLFRDKETAVVGGGNSAMDAALMLSKYAKRVYLIDVNPELRGDSLLIKNVMKEKNILVMNNAKTKDITGDNFVKSINVEHEGAEKQYPVQGVFIEIGMGPSIGFIDRTIDTNHLGEIVINKFCQTNVPGIFAAGDVTDVPEKQISVAVGEGSKAALGAYRYLIRG